MRTNTEHKIIEVKELNESTYILRFERNDLQFKPGQHLLVGKKNEIEQREYSIYSGTNDPYLEILIKEVDKGSVSKQLKSLKPGDTLNIDGPVGFFGLNKKTQDSSKILFIASGTGIAPFHSMVTSFPDLNYTLLHGVRNETEKYEHEHYNADKYLSCTSRDNSGEFNGRVTDYLKNHDIDNDTLCYFCGNFQMIRDAMEILEKKGIPSSQLHAEVYF